MKTITTLAAIIAALPAAALAQVSYSQARIAADPLVRDNYRTCVARQDSLADRKDFLDNEKREIDAAGADIAREAEWLGVELPRLQTADAAAVAAYNARSAEHNRRVAGHNRRVADMNAAAANYNGDSADMVAYCNLRTYRWRD